MSNRKNAALAAKILVVDDAPDNLDLLGKILSREGYIAIPVVDSSLAQEAAQAEAPDIILLDIIMPGLDGYEVCLQLKKDERTRDIPVIFISAKDEVFDKVKSFSVGGADYIGKPFQIEEVVVRIENQLKIQRLQKQLVEQNAILVQENSDRLTAEKALQENSIKTRQQNQLLTELARNKALIQGKLKTAFPEITEAAAENIEVERASIWLYNSKGSKIKCVDLFERKVKKHSEGWELGAVEYPAYFKALQSEKAIAASDAHTDPRTKEFSSDYLTPLGITSMLDIPIRVGGKTVGVLCLEHIGKARSWTPEEENFTRSLADLVSLALEARKRKQVEIALQQQLDRSNLLRQITEKIRSELDSQKIFETAATQIGRAFSVSRVLIHIYVARESRIPVVAEYLADNYASLQNIEIPVSGNPHAEKVLLSDKAIAVEDVYASPLFQPVVSLCRELKITSILAVRTSYKGKLNGMIGLHQCDRQRQWTKAEIELLESIAAQLGMAMAQASLLEQEKQARAELDKQNVQLQQEICDRLKAEAALKESESKYRALVESSQDMIWAVDNKGRFTFVNPAVKQIYGYEPSEMVGHLLTDFVPESQLADTVERFKQILAKKPLFQQEITHLNKDGKLIHLLLNAMPLQDEKGNIIGASGTASDITARKQLKEKLEQSEKFLNSIIENIPLALFVKDVTNDFRFLLWNKTCSEVFGGDRSEIVGRNDYDLLPKERADFLRSKDLEVVSSKELVEIPCEPIDSKSRGTILLRTVKVPISNAGKVTHLLCISEDITAKRVRENALRLIMEGTASTTGDNFMRSCVRYLAEVLQVRYAVIGKWENEDCTRVKTLAFWSGETWSEGSIEYDIEYTPCGRALEGEMYYCPENVQEVFPNNRMLFELKCQSYLGMPLIDSEGNIVGQLAIMDVLPMKYDASRESILKIFAARVGAELERQQIENELALREAQLNSFFSCAPVGLSIVNSQLQFVQINELLAEINGLSVQDHIGKTLQEVLPEFATNVEPLYQQVLATGKPILNQEVSGEISSKPGELRHWIVSHFPILAKNNRPLGVGVVVVEITDRKKAELEVRLANERLQHLLTYSPAVIFSCKTEGNYQITFTSENITAILGYEARQFLDDANFWISLIHPEDVERVFTEVVKVFEYEYHNYEYRLKHFDGNYRWMYNQLRLVKDSAGKPIEIVGYTVDISERKQAEEEVRESANREKAIATAIQRMRQTLDMETIFDATTYELRQVINCDRVGVYRFYSDWSGKFVAESVGSEWVSLLQAQPSDPSLKKKALEYSTCAVKGALSNDFNFVEDTYLQESKGGTYRNGITYRCVEDIYSAGFTDCYIKLLTRFQARAYIIVPIFSGSKLWGLLASYQNSGPRQWKTAEINIVMQIGNQLGVALQQVELLRQTKRQSAALQKSALAADAANRAKSEFLANMSHELRTPLNAILGFTQLMNRDSSLSTEHQQNLTIINRAGEHLLGLINDILEMSKIEAGRATLNEKSFDLIRLLDNLEQMLRLKAESQGLQLRFEYAPSLPRYVRTDSSKLRQVLLNLLGNAIKFTADGSVTLRVIPNSNSQSPIPSFPGSRLGMPNSLLFEVEDTGSGIAPEEIKLLFEAFVQTSTGKKSQQGTGLGLPISRKYVQLMGGDIRVTSTVGKGSLFAFDIKISVADTAEIQTTQKQRQVIGLAPNQAQYRILVVDDISESRLLLLKLLKSLDFCALEAENGLEAVALWESWQPNLIFMDMQMPVMDGYEATKEIRAREVARGAPGEQAHPLPKTAIVAFTASAFSEQRQAILSAGCDDFVSKPFQEEVLLEKISQHLGVQYLYKEETSDTENHSKQKKSGSSYEVDLLSLISQMSESWAAQVYHAAAQCSDRLIFQLIEQITPENTLLADALTNLANNFQFDKIMELTLRK